MAAQKKQPVSTLTRHHADERVTLYAGDCLDVLRELDDASVDAVVTDPPYGLEFMGKEWDRFGGDVRQPFRGEIQTPDNPYGRSTVRFAGASSYGARVGAMHSFQQWCELWATECLRVLKPGGHMLAFGGTRTWHRLACAVEDAGFEIRDSIAWLYGSGFPKSLDVSKAIDKAAGAERTESTPSKWAGRRPNACLGRGETVHFEGGDFGPAPDVDTAPATDDARTWQGWGSALKPAFEPVVVARKPLVGTIAQNVLAHGTGALNIAACRIGTDEDRSRPPRTPNGIYGGGKGTNLTASDSNPAGRWPANVILDESQAAALDTMTGELSHNPPARWVGGTDKTEGWGNVGKAEPGDIRSGIGDHGGASRFFLTAQGDECQTDQPSNNASTAVENSQQRSQSAASAQSDAATSAHPGTERPTPSPSTSAKANGSDGRNGSGTPPTPSTGAKSSPESPQTKPSQMVSRARYAAQLAPTDTTTTTTSPSKSDGSADPATSHTTSKSREAGAPGLPIDDLPSRFTYTAKAPGTERVKLNGTAHPTVKPLDLMRWLVRLVTPPGGLVLDPFAGSGTTVEACLLEGFRCVAIEREPDYLPLIMQRVNRRVDPVAAVKAANPGDAGLFDLIDECPVAVDDADGQYAIHADAFGGTQ